MRETWGAATALVQSSRADDPEIRIAMRTIADEEMEHAALSWDMDAWIGTQLSEDERATVRGERAAAVASVEMEIERDLPGDWARLLGLPSRDVARAMLEAMKREVFARA